MPQKRQDHNTNRISRATSEITNHLAKLPNHRKSFRPYYDPSTVTELLHVDGFASQLARSVLFIQNKQQASERLIRTLVQINSDNFDFFLIRTHLIDLKNILDKIRSFSNTSDKPEVWIIETTNALTENIDEFCHELALLNEIPCGIWIRGYVWDFNPKTISFFNALFLFDMSLKEYDSLRSVFAIADTTIERLRYATNNPSERDHVLFFVNYTNMLGAPLLKHNPCILLPQTHSIVTRNQDILNRMENRMETYADFHLHVDMAGIVRAKSDEGERQDKISLDISERVQSTLDAIEQDETDEELIEGLGKELYKILLPNSIHTHFNQTEASARAKNQMVRIRLTVEPNTLAHMPWEFIFRDERGYFLSINPHTVLSRYLDSSLPGSRITKMEESLDLLLIIAAPSDQPKLDPNEWEHIVKEALSKPTTEGKITIRVVKEATRRNISDALLEKSPNIVQFVGHGIYQNGKGYLALVDSNTGKTWRIDDTQFANLFLGAGSQLGLVNLATCESGKSDSPRSFLGIAPQIVQRGVPAVIAMQYSVRVSTAKIFLDEFYRSVAERKPLDWAVQWARNAISLEIGSGKREFATPVLYMRTKDGQVF